MDNQLVFTVAFDDADGEGIVFFGNYFKLAHRTLERWLPTVGVAWKDWFAREDAGAPLVHAECDYLKPLRPGEEFFVTVQVLNVGRSSVSFAQHFKSKDQSPVARIKTVHAFIDRRSLTKTEIPITIRACLAPLVAPAPL